MKLLSKYTVLLHVITYVALFSCLSEAGTFVAYSLKQAEKQLKESRFNSAEIKEIGGITRIAGMVYDEKNSDLIIVGQVNKEEEKVTLDDLVVAIRARIINKDWPSVSIDKTSETKKTGKQTIRFGGGIDNTKFARDLLEADIVLKKLGLGIFPTEISGIKSYFQLSAEDWEKSGTEDNISSRFWFYPKSPAFASDKGVFVIKNLKVAVLTQIMNAFINGKPMDKEKLTQIRDKLGDNFADSLADYYDELCVYYPEIRRLKILFDLVALANGIETFFNNQDINYWLNDYKVTKFETPKEYDLLKNSAKLHLNNKRTIMEIDGGVELKVLMAELKDGDITALRDVVLKSKPDGNSLIWCIPIPSEEWQIPGYPEITSKTTEKLAENVNSGKSKLPQNNIGTTLTRSFKTSGNSNSYADGFFDKPLPQLSTGIPKFDISRNLVSQRQSSRVGGVMLRDVAKVEGADEARVDLTSGNFSLVVDGRNARLDPEVFRKFVTALWSVYYGSEDPGISIDPIAPGVNKHLVRYIGKVMNNDLGRVMREADYVMKKWSVGTERPDIKGFKNPDDISGRRGYVYLAASRFWFIPENMKFKRGGDMLLFDDGRVTLKTEYLYQDNKDMHADPANEDFARFFTEHYKEISEKYPVYKDLFDYAKLVSLAKYLKENGVPLYWFLMANKDLVITEDSPGTVDAFAKGSDYFKDITIEGGVDLGFDVKQEGHYVYDQQAVDAINKALSKQPSGESSRTTMSVDTPLPKSGADPFTFDLGKESYTVLPQHSLTSGKDRRGIRYQTDIALRGAGFRLTGESLGNIEYYYYRRELAKEINPIVESMDKKKLEAEYENIYKEKSTVAKERAEKLLEKLKGLKDQDFKTEGMFAKALEGTLGKEQTDQLKPLIFKHVYYKTNLEIVRYFNPNKQDVNEFGKGWRLLIPYRIKPSGDDKRDYLNVRISEKMAVENLITGEQEVLTFSTDRYSSDGYVPEKIESSQVVGLFIMTNATYRLADKLGNQFWFDTYGYLTDMIFSEHHHVHIDYLAGFTDAFDHAPYHVQPASSERVKFLNVYVPRKMEVKDLVRGGGEVLTFSDKGDVAGYVPENKEKSRFQILALLSDTSFRLLDKEENEASFTFDGDFKGMVVHSKYPIAKSVSQGGHKVSFTYTADKSGKITIASARLSEDSEGAKPTYVVQYQYDSEGRLHRAKGPETKLAEAGRQAKDTVR